MKNNIEKSGEVVYGIVENLCLDYLWKYGKFSKSNNTLDKRLYKSDMDDIIHKIKELSNYNGEQNNK